MRNTHLCLTKKGNNRVMAPKPSIKKLKPLDLLLLCLLLYGAYTGYRKGLLLELVNTIGLLAALIAGFMLLDIGVHFLRPFFPKAGMLLPVAAFIVIFITVLWALRRLAYAVRKIVRQTLFGTLDAAAGGALGLLKIAFSVSTLLWAAGLIGLKLPRSYTDGTFIYPVLRTIGPKGLHLLHYLLPFLTDLVQEVKRLFR